MPIHALAAAFLWCAQSAPPLREYADEESLRIYAQAERASDRHAAELRERADLRCIAGLVERGLHRSDGRQSIDSSERARAIAALQSLSDPRELRAAYRVLSGQGRTPDLLERDPEVRRAMFLAMARDPAFGQPTLVEIAVKEDDPIRQRARDALPEVLSPNAIATLRSLLASDREVHINRAASLASVHPAAELIPSLVQAQYAPPRQTVGDEAWIAIGRTSHYIQNQIPLVGDASTSFQPVIGTLFEGSLLRILESKVEIYRTEVHESLAMVAERTTGKPAPPFGYDSERWLTWYREDFPALATAYAKERALEAEAARTRSTPASQDG